ncbi:methyl-accepting chemotaxis protein [uncultured Massilia sp.]|uniref:methyl-accepting chemotaxis protein n=1 Tax=uncultured Massilia sp. TaxID=169973 RepID=UPI0025EC3D2B|nr:methyl-accepting chemotaxis protein [uncultured Massilia sp.]
MNLNNLKVGTKLAIGYAIVLVLLAAIVATGLLKMREIKQHLSLITDTNNVQIMLVGTMRDSVSDRMIALRNIAILSDKGKMAREAEHLRALEQSYAQAKGKLGKTFEAPDTTSEERALFARLQQQEEAALPVMREAEELGLANRFEETNDLLMNKAAPLQVAWLETMSELARWEVKFNDDAAREAKDTYDSAVRFMLVLGALAIVAGIASATIVTRTLLRQLGGEPGHAAQVAARIAEGDLTVDVPVKSGDRGSMMLAMRAMRDNLANIVSEVRTSTETIATAAAQVSAGNLDLSSRTEQQAGSLEETASSLEELTSTVRQNAENAQQASVTAQSASEAAVKGGQVVGQVVDTMAAIDASARRIVDIIAVIDGIAFQTNILALNAAVEAARAGEQGRGFAVVAGEVRSLAHRAGAAAKEIKALIDDSAQKVGIGSNLVSHAGATMDEIVGRVRGVTDIMAEISAASREQSSGIEQVNQAVTQMDEVTQQNAALVEQASAASQAMQEQAARLAELVGTFRLAGTAAAAPTRVAGRAVPAPAQRQSLPPAAARQARPAPRKETAAATAWEAF